MTKAEELYGDIIHMDRPVDENVLRRHPRMSLQNRAKIFSPFAALRGFSERITEEEEKQMRETRREFSEDDNAEMAEKLLSLQKGATITVLRFEPDSPDGTLGCYKSISGAVTAVDFTFRVLRIRPKKKKSEVQKNQEISIAFEDIGDLQED